MSRSWRGGSTSAWRRTRAAVLANNLATNGGRCTLQTTVCTGQATEVHHTLGRSVTGDDPRYLQAVCGECNRYIGDPTKHEPRPKLRSRWTMTTTRLRDRTTGSACDFPQPGVPQTPAVPCFLSPRSRQIAPDLRRAAL